MNLSLRDVEFAYDHSPVLSGISLDLKPSEMIGLVGPNGSGKTTLLKCINRILQPRQGEILLDDRKILKMSRAEAARHFGYVPQTARSGFSAPSVFEAVLMGRRPHVNRRPGKADIAKAWEVLSLLDLENLASRGFDEISGGQRQKVLMARALAQEAGILLLDEPTSSLDIRHQLEVMELLSGLIDRRGVAAIAAMHDLNLAFRFCDKAIMMKDGRIFAAGDTVEVLTPGNIESVYGVEVAIDRCHARPHMVVLKNSSGDARSSDGP